MTWRKILAATDFSVCGDRATTLAGELARLHRAELVLLHVARLPAGMPARASVDPGDHHPIPAEVYLKQDAEASLAKVAEPLEAQDVRVSRVVEMGPVVEVILGVAERERVDLVVLGTHGRSGFMHLLMGSVAEQIVRRSPVPVLTLRDPRTRIAHDGLTEAEDHLRDETAG